MRLFLILMVSVTFEQQISTGSSIFPIKLSVRSKNSKLFAPSILRSSRLFNLIPLSINFLENFLDLIEQNQMNQENYRFHWSNSVAQAFRIHSNLLTMNLAGCQLAEEI